MSRGWGGRNTSASYEVLNNFCVGMLQIRRYFQHAHFMPIVGVGKTGAYLLVHSDVPRQHSFGTTLRFTGPVPADSRQ